MGRPSKLTPTQWGEVGKRLCAGELATDLAQEYGISDGLISQRFSKESKNRVRNVAERLAALPKKEHSAVVTLADELRSISGHLAAAGRYGSATAHRLHALAHGEVQKIDDAEPLGSIEALKGVAAFTRVANEAAATGLALLGANKDQGRQEQSIVIDGALARV